ncbi:uncharacterized protein LOC134228019 isoform X2 [Armigeres subalbatus]|uniref:uncharacterized protein LOC134228019 isoform X2 n=1 Tax=Armigeres subalbatus TaxID=124917 RepID=UPI002ED43F68
MRCSVKGCRRNSRTDRISFYRFPTTSSLRSEWIKFCGDDNLNLTVNSRVCGDHFDVRTSRRFNNLGQQIRSRNAIPTIKVIQHALPLYASPALFDHTYAEIFEEDAKPDDYLGDDEEAMEESSNECDLPDSLPVSIEHQSKPLSKKCCARNISLMNLWRRRAQHWKAEFLKLSKQFELPQKLSRIYNNDQIQVALGRVKKVRKWSDQTILRGLQTRFACGKGYDYLRQQNQPYPSTRTLLEHIQNVPFDTGMYV